VLRRRTALSALRSDLMGRTYLRVRSSGDLLLAVPALIIVGVFIIVPLVQVIVRSFFDWQPGLPSPFVGLSNYTDLFASEQFQKAMKNQAFLLLGLPLFIILPMMIALVLFERVKGAALFRTIYFFPSVLAPPIVAIMMRSVLASDGLINSFFEQVGLSSLVQPWLTSETLVKPTLIAILAWANLGIGVIIFSSALSALPVENLEAATVDGANWWQRLWYIVVPDLRPTIELWATYQAISLFAFAFGWIYVLTNGGPNSASTTLDFDIYQNALLFGFFGSAAAESVVLLLIVGMLGAIRMLLARREKARQSVEPVEEA
jgi:ABC-type sugar transport system permease subunit